MIAAQEIMKESCSLHVMPRRYLLGDTILGHQGVGGGYRLPYELNLGAL